jgi:hypothetical protein
MKFLGTAERDSFIVQMSAEELAMLRGEGKFQTHDLKAGMEIDIQPVWRIVNQLKGAEKRTAEIKGGLEMLLENLATVTEDLPKFIPMRVRRID